MVNVKSHFRNISDALTAAARVAAGTGHSSTTGTAREALLKRFLRPHIPDVLSIGSGIIIDSFGHKSRQQDVVITDRRLPVIDIGDENNSIFLAESVLGTIEVKSHLSKKELFIVMENTRSVKNLKQVGKQVYSKGGLTVDLISEAWIGIYSYVIAYDGDSIGSLYRQCVEMIENEKKQEMIPNVICVLNRGIIHLRPARPQYLPDRQVCIMPDFSSATISYRELAKDALLEFYRLIADDIFFTRMDFFNIEKYYEFDQLE